MLTFEAWEPLIKARKAKGLENWQRLQHVADKLVGKKMSDITFTSSHPMYRDSGPVKHTLGSSTGNMHFLMGYVSPGFHVAPYHWMIVDPYMDEEEASNKDHPANMKAWKDSGLPLEAEGDLDEGSPLGSYKQYAKQKQEEQDIKKEAVFAKAGYGRYIGIPSMGIVFDVLNKKKYTWDIVRGSYLAATNPKFYEDMENARVSSIDTSLFIEKSVNSYVLLEATNYIKKSFNREVYPVVQEYMPQPGSIIDMHEAYGVVTDSSVLFFSKEGNPATIDVFDKSISSISLMGDSYPSLILNFMEQYLDVPRDSIISSVFKSNDISSVVAGEASPGSSNWDFNTISSIRDIETDKDGTMRVVSRI